jgi:hypothetical protein
MLHQTLSAHPDLWSLYRESQPVIEQRFGSPNCTRASAEDNGEAISNEEALEMEADFYRKVGNLERLPVAISQMVPLIIRTKASRLYMLLARSGKKAPIRIVEKTPDNCFRIRLLRKIFPSARFLFVVRDPRACIASIYRGWHDKRYRSCVLPNGYRLHDFDTKYWSFGLPPGWHHYNGKRLIDICAFQWIAHNQHALNGLADVADHVMWVRYEELAASPGPVLDKVAEWADLDPEPLDRFKRKVPVVNTWSKPRPDKWRSLEQELRTVLPGVADMAVALGYDPEQWLS